MFISMLVLPFITTTSFEVGQAITMGTKGVTETAALPSTATVTVAGVSAFGAMVDVNRQTRAGACAGAGAKIKMVFKFCCSVYVGRYRSTPLAGVPDTTVKGRDRDGELLLFSPAILHDAAAGGRAYTTLSVVVICIAANWPHCTDT